VATEARRPAFYALASGGWRDYVTLLHLPYTAWHLSYVTIGAALAPSLLLSRFLPTLAAFFLGLGIGAHALDELNGRPLRTRIPGTTLTSLAVVSLAGAVAIGIVGAVVDDGWIGAFVAVGVFAAVAYNLELFRGRFHGDGWFALFWGSFPLLTGYFAVAETIRGEAVAASVFAFALSLAQRRLSTPVRDLRRRVRQVSGTIERHDGTTETIDAETLIGPSERALQALTVATVALAVALVIMRLA
jgi:hypothetical protein